MNYQLYIDEANYIFDKLKECEEYGNMYYVHSKAINSTTQKLLETNELFVSSNTENDYTYICKQKNKNMALEQMPLI